MVLKRTIDIHVPIQTAYRRAVQLENFPSFIDHLSRVTRMDRKNFRLLNCAAEGETELHVELVEEIPYTRIAWRSDQGMRGSLALSMLSDRRCRLTAYVEPKETVDLDGLTNNLEGDLVRFKTFVESLESDGKTPN